MRVWILRLAGEEESHRPLFLVVMGMTMVVMGMKSQMDLNSQIIQFHPTKEIKLP